MGPQFKADRNMLTNNDDGRRDGFPRLLGVHTSEGRWREMSADNLAMYQLRPEADGSYHIIIDATGRTVRSNDDEFIPWAAGWTGNRIALHVCLVGTSSFTRDEWLGRRAQLDALRRWVDHCSDQYGIPRRRLVGSAIKTPARGLCGHADISAAYGESDHWDPGPNFPYDYIEGDQAPAPGPAPGGGTHVVQPGDTLSSIGRQYGTTWQTLAQLNAQHLIDPSRIRPGQLIKLP